MAAHLEEIAQRFDKMAAAAWRSSKCEEAIERQRFYEGEALGYRVAARLLREYLP